MLHNPSKRPLKRFGQNFLTNPHYQQKIVSSLDIRKTDAVLEIGPGRGALSRHIVAANPHKYWAVEIDRRWAEELKVQFGEKINLVEEDFLEINLEQIFEQAGGSLKIIGNIPYNITTPILFKLIESYQNIERLVLMTQKEVAQRISAVPGTKAYGILSVIAQVYGRAEYLFSVGGGNFFPVPAVDSAVIAINFFNEISGIEDETLFRGLVRQVFNYRRKMLRNSLSGMFDKSIVNSVNSKFLTLRPEALSVEDFKQLSNEISTAKSKNR